MKIAILTTRDPMYVPSCVGRILASRSGDVAGVFAVKTVYKGKPAAITYLKSFGFWNFVQLVLHVLWAKLKDLLRIGHGRGEFHSIRSAARHYGVHYEEVAKVNDPQFIQHLRDMGVDLILSVSCPQIFKDELIRMPALGVLNLHGAPLPRYRGLLPSFWMLHDGLDKAAVTIFMVNAGIDTGDFVGQRWFGIDPDESLHQFLIRAKRESAELAIEALDQVEQGTVQTYPPEGEGSYFTWPTRGDYRKFRRAGRRLW